MELKWLEDFLSLAKTCNFSKSARERNVTQPAFSRRIRALEGWLGVKLIDRATYPIRLTRAGEAFLPTAQDMLRRLKDERVRLCGDSQNSIDILSFAAQHSLALGFFPDWLKSLHRHLGPFRSRLVADNFHDCVQLLIEGNCQLLLCFSYCGVPYLLDRRKFPSVLLSRDRLVPVTSAKGSRRHKYDLDCAAASSIPYLAYAPDSFLGGAVDLILQRNTNASKVLFPWYENSLAEALKAMAADSQGVAWIPERTIAAEVASGQLCIAGGDSWTLPLEVHLCRRATPSSGLLETLWAYLTDASGTGTREIN